MNGVDVNCLLGHWPFRKLHHSSLGDLRKLHAAHGICSGYIASLNSIFYNDPFEGEEELHAIIKDTPYHHVLTVNPTLPGFQRDIDRGVERFGIKAVRVYPSYHAYNMRDEAVSLLGDTLQEYDLPLFITMRMEDERLNYLREVPAPQEHDLRQFLETYLDLPVVLLNPLYSEIISIKGLLKTRPNLMFDTAGLGHNLFPIEKLIDSVGENSLVYGSLFPLKAVSSSILQLEIADISEASRNRILYRNIGELNVN